MDINEILEYHPFQESSLKREIALKNYLNKLTSVHYVQCGEDQKFLDAIAYNINEIKDVDRLPFLPVRVFKDYSLKSVEDSLIFKTMTSSGTTGQAVSKVFLDKLTSQLQSKALSKSVNSFIGNRRVPMLIIDSPSVLRDRNSFSARGAEILGFSIFGRERIFALNDDMSINYDLVEEFLSRNNGKRILLFGFTFMIWQHFVKEIQSRKFDISNGILFHGGGWKKLESEKVDDLFFKEALYKACGIREVHNYYGMVEQTGSIYIECEEGFMHSSSFNDVIVRNEHDLSVADYGTPGVIQVLSILPHSYPGHSLLTEDEGILYGRNDCKCGRGGAYFKVLGRLKNAEVRGCSDTYEKK